MNAEELLTQMRAVLATERDAIRRLDSATVAESAKKKEALLAAVSGATDADKPALVQALAAVREDLKRNLVLLAHARDCVKEAITIATPRAGRPGGRLSVQL